MPRAYLGTPPGLPGADGDSGHPHQALGPSREQSAGLGPGRWTRWPEGMVHLEVSRLCVGHPLETSFHPGSPAQSPLPCSGSRAFSTHDTWSEPSM